MTRRAVDRFVGFAVVAWGGRANPGPAPVALSVQVILVASSFPIVALWQSQNARSGLLAHKKLRFKKSCREFEARWLDLVEFVDQTLGFFPDWSFFGTRPLNGLLNVGDRD